MKIGHRDKVKENPKKTPLLDRRGVFADCFFLPIPSPGGESWLTALLTNQNLTFLFKSR